MPARQEAPLVRYFPAGDVAMRMILCLLPMLILYGIYGNTLILLAALPAISLQVCVTHSNTSLRFLALLTVVMASATLLVLFSMSIKHTPLVFVLTITVLISTCSLLAGMGEHWQTIGAFLFIPALYLGYETAEYQNNTVSLDHSTLIILLQQFFLSFASVLFVNKGYERWTNRNLDRPSIQNNWFPEIKSDAKTWQQALHLTYARTLGVAIAAYYVCLRHPALGQWVIWSAASVALGDSTRSLNKGKQRLQGAIFGLAIGLPLARFIPHQPWIDPIGIVIVALSIAGMQPYFLAFGIRCMIVVIIAGNSGHALDTAIARLTDVAIGALIGLIASSLVLTVSQWRHKALIRTK